MDLGKESPDVARSDCKNENRKINLREFAR